MMRHNPALLVLTTTLFIQTSIAQDVNYVKSIIDSLCAPRYDGRGYVNDGDAKAAKFIQRQVKLLDPSIKVVMQEFELGVNTFPGQFWLSTNGVARLAGEEFIIDPKSGGLRGDFEAVTFKSRWAKNQESLFSKVANGKFEGKLVAFDAQTENTDYKTLIENVHKNPLKAAGYIIVTSDKLTWSVSRSMLDFPVILMHQVGKSKKIKNVSIDIEQEFQSEHKSTNVIATLPGTGDHKSKLVFTAHLDHLGRMGAETYIPGANDNASGSAMLLDLMRRYMQQPHKEDIVFIWFEGEEAGLVGSRHYVENPTFPFDQIKFLMNLDLMGDAKTGITVVNGKVYEEQFAKLSSLNMELGFVENVNARGPAANSDHYPFYEKGVPCFFIYTTGDYTHYHDINDKPENLPMTNYAPVFELIIQFMNEGI
ncbi:MAG: M28 family peptidase [Flavobacteriales bacterium]